MWILQLNHVTSSAETVVPVFRSETQEELLTLLDRETVEPYKDEEYIKSYRKGGPLEWFNPPYSDGTAFVHVPALMFVSEEDWIQLATAYAQEQWQRLLREIPPVT